MRYYSTQRPVGPGTFPKLPENKVLEVHNFDAKTFCEEIGREAWGYIDFESPLTQEQADNYELIAPGVGCTGCVNETASRDMDCCWNCSRNRRSKKDLYRRRPAGGCSRDRLCKDPHGTGRRTGRLPVRTHGSRSWQIKGSCMDSKWRRRRSQGRDNGMYCSCHTVWTERPVL